MFARLCLVVVSVCDTDAVVFGLSCGFDFISTNTHSPGLASLITKFFDVTSLHMLMDSFSCFKSSAFFLLILIITASLSSKYLQ